MRILKLQFREMGPEFMSFDRARSRYSRYAHTLKAWKMNDLGKWAGEGGPVTPEAIVNKTFWLNRMPTMVYGRAHNPFRINDLRAVSVDGCCKSFRINAQFFTSIYYTCI